MKIHCIVNDAFLDLYRTFFVSTVPKELVVVEHRSCISAADSYMRPLWRSVIHEKVDTIIQTLKESSGEIMIWSDVDIIFNPKHPTNIEKEIESLIGDKQLIFMKEWIPVEDKTCNNGFFAVRSTPYTICLFQKVKEMLFLNDKIHDQDAFNTIRLDRSWCLAELAGTLPYTYSSTTNAGLCSESRLFHGNWTSDIDQKNTKLKEAANFFNKQLESCSSLP